MREAPRTLVSDACFVGRTRGIILRERGVEQAPAVGTRAWGIRVPGTPLSWQFDRCIRSKCIRGDSALSAGNEFDLVAPTGALWPHVGCPPHALKIGGRFCCRNYGYDPLGLAKEPALLARFREGELINGRWAMMAVAGMLTVEALGYGNWFDAPKWVSVGC